MICLGTNGKNKQKIWQRNKRHKELNRTYGTENHNNIHRQSKQKIKKLTKLADWAPKYSGNYRS